MIIGVFQSYSSTSCHREIWMSRPIFSSRRKGARQEILQPWYGEEFQSQKRRRSYHSLAYSQDCPGQSWGWNSDPTTLTKPCSMMWTVAIPRESGLCFWPVLPDRIFDNFNRNLKSLSCLKTFPRLSTTCKIHFKLFLLDQQNLSRSDPGHSWLYWATHILYSNPTLLPLIPSQCVSFCLECYPPSPLI